MVTQPPGVRGGNERMALGPSDLFHRDWPPPQHGVRPNLGPLIRSQNLWFLIISQPYDKIHL